MNEVTKLYENAGVDFGYNNFGVPNIHPLFTAEKQLELIKWLALRDDFGMMAWQNSEYHIEHDKYNANENSLEGCLARLINDLWQDLTEEERKQIKNILESEVNLC